MHCHSTMSAMHSHTRSQTPDHFLTERLPEDITEWQRVLDAATDNHNLTAAAHYNAVETLQDVETITSTRAAAEQAQQALAAASVVPKCPKNFAFSSGGCDKLSHSLNGLKQKNPAKSRCSPMTS